MSHAPVPLPSLPLQILNYLVTCDRLCELGYDEGQVEEALEMFQNCETKVSDHMIYSSASSSSVSLDFGCPIVERWDTLSFMCGLHDAAPTFHHRNH